MAPTALLPSMTTVQVVPVQAPVQLWKTWVAVPVAFRVTDVPAVNDALADVQIPEALKPAGLEFTLYPPVPPRLGVKIRV